MKYPNPISIHLGKPTNDLPIGASHWFGYPDLPPDVAIPTVEEDGEEYALTLVCQINLADLPIGCEALPQKGLLLFFADIAYYRGDWDEPAISMYPSDNRVCRVLYVPEERMGDLVSRREQYVEQDEVLAIPIDFSADNIDNVENDDTPDHQLLGTSSHLEWDTWPAPCENWQLLLQMDSMEGDGYTYNFVDWGVLCFIIEPEALQRKDFTNVRAIILST